MGIQRAAALLEAGLFLAGCAPRAAPAEAAEPARKPAVSAETPPVPSGGPFRVFFRRRGVPQRPVPARTDLIGPHICDLEADKAAFSEGEGMEMRGGLRADQTHGRILDGDNAVRYACDFAPGGTPLAEREKFPDNE